MINRILESSEVKEVEKHKVTELEIVVGGLIDKPCYSIRYFDIADMEMHIGYSSYDLKNVVEWKNEYFEEVGADGWIPCSERLPEEHQIVIVYMRGEGIAETGDSITFMPYSSNVLSWWKNVIAWQPLPEPYKGDPA